MSNMRPPLNAVGLCIVQGLSVFVALALLALAPTEGRAIVIPLTPAAGMTLMKDLYQEGLIPLDAGPIVGSIVVAGDHHGRFLNMLQRGRLVVAAPRAGCGAGLS